MGIDIKAYFNPIARGDLVTYPDTFDTIGIGPITKWEPNQAITSVQKKNAIALLHAICDLRPEVLAAVRSLLGTEFSEVEQDINRYVIAKSKLGGAPVVESSSKDFQDEFITWWCDVKKRAEKTARNYIGYLASLNKPIGEKNNSTWPGVYVYLFGRKSSKEVIQVGALDQFDEIFGPFCRIFDDSGCPEGANPDAYASCVQWVKDVSQWACLSSAFKAYREFLEWREAQQTGKEEPKVAAADLLTVALKMFAEKRAVDKPSGWDSYDAWTKGVREEFSQVDESLLTKPGFDYVAYLRKFSHSDEEKHEILKFLREQKESPKSVSWYIDDANRLEVGGNRVDGMSAKTLLYFMSELRPAEFAPWTEPTYEGLAFLGLHKGPAPKELTVETYEDCKAKQHQIVARMKELGIGKASDDATDPDYRTVNEFLWWLGQDDNKNLIKEKIMSKKMKTDAPTKYDEGKRKPLEFKSDSKDDELLMRLLAALRAKPFAILAGHSGTGKSRYVKKLAYMTCNMDELRNENQLPGNYLLLQVKPNWHDSTELLGFRNAMDGDRYQKTKLIEFLFRAYQFKDTPFFLCLDEMNLAPVEQYFAEFLSSMESAEPVPLNDITVKDDNLFNLGCEWEAAYDYLAANGFSIPKNLFIVGTVNMDETTNQFSRKVLDRAFTIEMTDVDFKNYGHVTQPSYDDTIEEEKIQALLNGEKFVDKLDDEDVAEGAPLVKVQKALEPTAFAVAYRFANEYTLLKRAIACFDKDSTMKLDALDQAVLMKILPRVAGEKDYIEKVYGKNDNEGLRKALEGKSVSLKKIAEIMKRANDMNAQYITFWP